MDAEPPLSFCYFQLWARVSPAVALAHSGLEWTGKFPAAWKELKPTTPWGALPVLETSVGVVGHELAILSHIAKKAGPAMEGADEKEQLTSLQLMSESEDIYQALGRLKNGGTPEQGAAFWTGTDATKHNRQFGLAVFLTLLERFHGAAGAGEGRFTASGISVGERTLGTTLHILILIKEDVLAGYPSLQAFYDRFTSLPATQSFITTGAAMGAPVKQYFKMTYE